MGILYSTEIAALAVHSEKNNNLFKISGRISTIPGNKSLVLSCKTLLGMNIHQHHSWSYHLSKMNISCQREFDKGLIDMNIQRVLNNCVQAIKGQNNQNNNKDINTLSLLA